MHTEQLVWHSQYTADVAGYYPRLIVSTLPNFANEYFASLQLKSATLYGYALHALLIVESVLFYLITMLWELMSMRLLALP